MKRILTAILLASFLLGLCACGVSKTPATTQETTAPIEQPVLRVLTLGHSLALDSGHMLALIAAKEGGLNLKLGTLYYSGCTLQQHVEFMDSDSPKYNLYVSSTEESYKPPERIEAVTMRQAIEYEQWDVVVMQGGATEIARNEPFTNGNIQRIQAFVDAHKQNPDVVFAWHMPWAPPTDADLLSKYPYADNPYISTYQAFDNDRSKLYGAITQCVADNILTDETFKFLIPTGTAIENALSSYLEEKELHRDYIHASDLGRVIAAYTWYCKLAGVSQLEELKLDMVPWFFLLNNESAEDFVLTDNQKTVVLEAVNNALDQPLKLTPSQFTEG